MKRFIVYIEGQTFGNWVWAQNKREARKQMAAYARCVGGRIVRVEEV